jgi:hypothetical protein
MPKTCWRKDSFFNKWYWENWNWMSTCRRLKLDPNSLQCKKRSIQNGSKTSIFETTSGKHKVNTEDSIIGKNFLNRTPNSSRNKSRT